MRLYVQLRHIFGECCSQVETSAEGTAVDFEYSAGLCMYHKLAHFLLPLLSSTEIVRLYIFCGVVHTGSSIVRVRMCDPEPGGC